jgi:hypothetical protein
MKIRCFSFNQMSVTNASFGIPIPVPGIVALHNGAYRHQPDWYRNFV